VPLDKVELFHPILRREGYEPKSDATPLYNCVAWALGRNGCWWDHSGLPGTCWPDDVPREDELENYVAVFLREGYEPCESREWEAGYEKVAIYARRGEFQHVAKSTDSGKWTSKIGEWEDVDHNTLAALEDFSFGQVYQVLRRPSSGTSDVEP
jgi:hypothetical protein